MEQLPYQLGAAFAVEAFHSQNQLIAGGAEFACVHIGLLLLDMVEVRPLNFFDFAEYCLGELDGLRGWLAHERIAKMIVL